MECGSSNYDKQSGVAAQLEHKRKFLLAVRAMAGDDIHFLSAIGIRPKATPELIRNGVVISSQCGADGLSLANLEAIRQGMADAGVTI